MEENTKLEEMAQKLRNYGFITEQIENSNLDKVLLVAMKKGIRGKIMIFDQEIGEDEIASMAYTINNNGVYLSTFMVNEAVQQNGLGRFMWQLAMAHGDALGKNCIYGEANPTDPIKGISGKEGVAFEDEQNAIKQIYKKLGCTLEEERFTKTWKEGEILKNTSGAIKALVNRAIDNQPEPRN